MRLEVPMDVPRGRTEPRVPVRPHAERLGKRIKVLARIEVVRLLRSVLDHVLPRVFVSPPAKVDARFHGGSKGAKRRKDVVILRLRIYLFPLLRSPLIHGVPAVRKVGRDVETRVRAERLQIPKTALVAWPAHVDHSKRSTQDFVPMCQELGRILPVHHGPE